MIYRVSVLVCAGLVASSGALMLPSPCAARFASPAACVAASPRAAVCLCDAAPAEEAEAAAPVEAAAEEAPAKKPARAGKTPLEELETGAEIEGKIRSVMAYGAFVDIGAATDGLLHVSEICNEFVKDATEKLTAGDSIKCRIKAVNLEKGQVALTAKDPNAAPPQRGPRKARPDLSEYESADEKEFVTGKVNSITDFGAFVTLKEGVDGLVHISQIQEGGVGKVSDVLTLGQEVQVRIEQVDKAKRRIGLSMLPWSEDGPQKKRGGGGGRGFADAGFGAEADAAFQMNAEELEGLTVGESFASPFEAAFEREKFVKETKASKSNYARQVL